MEIAKVPSYEEVEVLAERLRFDLASAGFAVLRPEQEDEPEGGLLVGVDKGRVCVSWAVHERLADASLDMEEAGRDREDVVLRYETVRAAMHLALGSILNAFGYRTVTRGIGFGHTVLSDS
ncbi:hypothetical protein [Streptomyces noursei]|uniref:hypothetical protein n=1 Tax=Streptomyces noursei TaxID=1971 RepID=UPI0016735283|nr:hypothetical protein [Streptomyces noursei]MCZ1021102.1 hypothetical protein [Streptomyces noursei]MCZ1021133.1 hypothetical protein [Streptomyces noursei]MCZ1021472.1 hypothetical protein [Streptomyces noursei]GGX51493.1 hypothetical protein GCM10010341_86250 [Streptomyces noursei]